MVILEEENKRKYFVIGGLAGLASISVGFIVNLIFGRPFPNFEQALVHGIIGVAGFITIPLFSKRSWGWGFASYWFSITNLIVTSVAVFQSYYMFFIGDPLEVLIWLNIAGFLVVYLPAQLFSRNVLLRLTAKLEIS
jgi:hypothetical protein